jgi:hypothetical protein
MFCFIAYNDGALCFIGRLNDRNGWYTIAVVVGWVIGLLEYGRRWDNRWRQKILIVVSTFHHHDAHYCDDPALTVVTPAIDLLAVVANGIVARGRMIGVKDGEAGKPNSKQHTTNRVIVIITWLFWLIIWNNFICINYL